jgi:hypothetical protein
MNDCQKKFEAVVREHWARGDRTQRWQKIYDSTKLGVVFTFEEYAVKGEV